MQSRDVLIVEEMSKEIGVPIEVVYTTGEREQTIGAKIHMEEDEYSHPVEYFTAYAGFDKASPEGSLAIVDEQGRAIRLYINNAATMTVLPGSLFTLENLQLLGLCDNSKLIYLPVQLSLLLNLQLIYLTLLNITELPIEIVSLPNLKHLICRSLELSSPPQEIAEQGLEAIKNYFESVETSDEVTYLYEAKMVLVGRGFAGKTSLVRKLTIPDYQLEKNIKSTEGIGIDTWDIKLPLDNSDSFRFNIWDFAGQEKYDATHQFFITERTLYLFVTEARQESNFLDFDYWLNIVQLLGNGSPVIVVQNKTDLRCKKLPTENTNNSFLILLILSMLAVKTVMRALLITCLNRLKWGFENYRKSVMSCPRLGLIFAMYWNLKRHCIIYPTKSTLIFVPGLS